MALRRFHTASSNQETYGKLIVDGLNDNSGTINIEVNYQPQFPLVNFARSYQRNPFWFSKGGLNIYRLVDSGVSNTYDIYMLNSNSAPAIMPNAFSDAVVFADWRVVTDNMGTLTADYSDSFCKTLSKNSWHFASTTSDEIEQVVLDIPVTIDRSVSSGGGYDLYMLISEQESILGDIFAIIRDNKVPFGSNASVWDTPNTVQGIIITDIGNYEANYDGTNYSLGNISDDFTLAAVSQIVEPVIFTTASSTQVTDGYQFYIEDDGVLLLDFDSTTNVSGMCVVLIRADLPLATVKYPSGLHSTSFDVTYDNFPYSRMELNTRTL